MANVATIGAGGAASAAAIGAFVHSLLDGKRAALFGDGTTGLAEQLALHSGRRLQVYDPDATRTAEAIARSRGASSQVRHTLLEADAEPAGQPFDVVVIPNLLELTSGELAAPAVIAVARRLATAHGVIVVAAPNPEHAAAPGDEKLGYYQLFDLMAAEFEHVAMLGQAPFVGYSVARFGAESEPAVVIDTSLTSEPEEPLAFVAIGSARRIDLDAFTLIQVQAEQFGAEPAPAAPEAVTRVPRSLEVELRDRIRVLERREQELISIADDRQGAMLTLSARAAELDAILAGVQSELEPLHDRLETAEKELSIEREATRDAFARAKDDEERLAHAYAHKSAAYEEEIARILDRAALPYAADARVPGAEAAPSSPAERTVPRAESPATDDGHPATLRRPGAPAPRPSGPTLASTTLGPSPSGNADAFAPPTTARAVFSPAQVDAPRADEERSRAHEFQLAELRRALDAARVERDQLRLEAARAAVLDAEVERLERRMALLATPPEASAADDHEGDVAALERQLRERGGWVAKLERELRDAERIGRELVQDLEAARAQASAGAASVGPASAGDGSAGDGSTGDGSAGPLRAAGHDANGTLAAAEEAAAAELARLRADVDGLSRRCARHDADLEQARLVNAALERRLAERPDDGADHEALEVALLAAHEENARLRQAAR